MKKYVRFRQDGQVLFGEVRGEDVALLTGSILDGTLEETGETVRLDAVREYLPPLDFPDILCIGANYADHCKECTAEPPKYPLLSSRARTRSPRTTATSCSRSITRTKSITRRNSRS